MPRNPAARDREGRGRGAVARTPKSISVAALAPISAAKNPRCWNRSRASAAGRGTSRHFPAQVGLFGRPTLINNVETLFWVRDIVEKGPSWFTEQGRNGRKGLRTFSVSGRVRSPGVKLAPAGITIRELIDEYCGGMPDGHAFKGYLPGGASGGILPASMGDIPLDFGTLEPHGCFIGSAAVIVLSDQDDMREVALNLLKFFQDESCGQCTPCRVGTEKAVTLMERPQWDETLLERVDEGDDRRLDLRARPSRHEPGQAGFEALPGRPRSRSGASRGAGARSGQAGARLIRRS